MAIAVPSAAPPASPVRFLDRLADALDTRRYTPALVRAYVEWARRFLAFHHKRHPVELGEAEVRAPLPRRP
jgi:hypothetical protein